MTTIRQHDYIDGKCQHCGDKESDNVGERAGRACVSRETPRSIPVSVFHSLSEIGERLKEIRAEEEAARSEKPENQAVVLADPFWADILRHRDEFLTQRARRAGYL